MFGIENGDWTIVLSLRGGFSTPVCCNQLMVEVVEGEALFKCQRCHAERDIIDDIFFIGIEGYHFSFPIGSG